MRHTITFLFIGLGVGTYVEVAHQQFLIKRGEIQPVQSGFFKVFHNRSLNTFFLLANIRAAGDIECALVCLRIKVCLSFNFAIVPDANQYTCQILATDKYRDPHRFALSDQFHHYAMPVLSPCLTDPCPHNFTCEVEFRDQGYTCLSACNRSMGMETGKILDGQISASSQYDAYHATH
ncbi:uncharacterized protein [Acropora muricata]|uniref:uncharacterized protein n=1 Tax=Acropora muricata TaxID=159855 RepID=UPI0034E396E8